MTNSSGFINNLEKSIQESNRKFSIEEVMSFLRPIGLHEFSQLLFSLPRSDLPALSQILPSMAAKDVQIDWTGNFGDALLNQTLDFYLSVKNNLNKLGVSQDFSEWKILDFGCGYGRFARIFTHEVQFHNYFGVDPWEDAIEICHGNNLGDNFSVSEYLPVQLPFEDNSFDLIFAFSVFTHLSFNATQIALNTLFKYLKDDGFLVITIRPQEYWSVDKLSKDQNISSDLIDKHSRFGFAFNPHNRESHNGEITYGDTSMSIEFIESNFPQYKVLGIDTAISDKFQIYVFLGKNK